MRNNTTDKFFTVLAIIVLGAFLYYHGFHQLGYKDTDHEHMRQTHQ